MLVAIAGLLAAASCAYHLAALAVLGRRGGKAPSAPQPSRQQAGISILKPAIGAGAEFADLLRSHAAQDYADFEILVGIGQEDRAVREAVRAVRAESRGLRIELVECHAPKPGCNGKAHTLQELAARATKPVWVLSDADVRAPSGYLAQLAAELAAPGTGMVTCLYRGEPSASVAADFEACRINTEFPAQVLLASALQGLRFGLGATIGVRAETLSGMGGFPAFLGVIGDDYHIGAKVAATGRAVRLSDMVVSTRMPQGTSWKQSWRRQLRWSRTIRKQRPLGHFGLGCTFAVPWSALALLAEPAMLWPLAALATGLRLLAGWSSVRVVRARGAARWLWLAPAADLYAAAVWFCSLLGSEVWWAGRRLSLGPQGRIVG